MSNSFPRHDLPSVVSLESIVTVYHFEYSPDFHFTGEKHDFWEFAYVENGPVGVMAESTGYALRPGEIIFHKPNEYHNIWANGESAHVVIVSFVSQSPALEYLRNKILTCSAVERGLIENIVALSDEVFLPRLAHCNKETLPQVLEHRLKKRADQPFGSEQLLKQAVESLLIRLIRSNAQIERDTRSSHAIKEENEQRIAEAVLNYIDEHLCETITLDDVCSALCFSKSYIKRVFKARTGNTILDTALTRKLEAAKELLLTHTVTQTAETLGFSSIHYFSRLFRQKTGLNPREFQRKNA
ncbi:MAG: helix-turn-helix transcriptional regulator [Oscillospiraceae bacterium]|nr:helix-turn-helix transcriptional regulator [Oscillospiraceae bacterium]